MPMQIEDEVRSFVESNFYLGRGGIGRGDSLIAAGVLDGEGLLELIAFVEATFQLYMTDDEVVPENLDSIANISSYVARKRGILSLAV